MLIIRGFLVKIGIIICELYKNCAGGKCFRSLARREGAFARYSAIESVQIAGYTGCGGCPGGNIEYAPEEMIRNGVEVIHLATGFIVGYPPCPYTEYFKKMIEGKFGVPVVVGTHPIPQRYFTAHTKLETWTGAVDRELIAGCIADEKLRREYD